MKKVYSIFLITIVALLSTDTVFAQRSRVEREIDAQYFPRHEIYVHYGSPTVMELVTVLPAPKEFNADTKDQVFVGAPGIGYNISLSEDFSLGIFGGYSYSKANIYALPPKGVNADELLLYGIGVRSYVGQLSANWVYFKEDDLELSTGLYLGAAFWDEDIHFYADKGILAGLITEDFDIPHSSEQWKLSYHFTACKVRYGDTFGVFGELGFGYRGLVNVGISIKL
ncbi:MAG: hypothetical protein J6S16_04655 [Bacteroidales bacterium]|nr:hypothetical protein [Bacteroidales bacterium]